MSDNTDYLEELERDLADDQSAIYASVRREIIADAIAEIKLLRQVRDLAIQYREQQWLDDEEAMTECGKELDERIKDSI